jgi:hypothetical protein
MVVSQTSGGEFQQVAKADRSRNGVMNASASEVTGEYGVVFTVLQNPEYDLYR